MKRLLFLLVFISTSLFSQNPLQGIEGGKTSLVAASNEIPGNSYSLKDLLENVSKIYMSPIQEAIRAIAPREEASILFQPLLGGFSKSKIFIFSIKDKKYVLRLLDENKAIERRRSELAAHKIGAKLQIAPQLAYVDAIPLVVVMDFIEGRTLCREDLDNKEIVKKIMQTIKKFHQAGNEENLLKRTKVQAIGELYDRLKTKKSVVYPSCFEGLFQKLQNDFANLERKRAPSHGDFNPRNILIAKDGNIYLIDWAEASIDHPLLDIGWLSCMSAASDDQIKNLLREYFGREPKESEIKETLFFREVTNFLVATLWIGRQEEKDQEKLDAILRGPLKKSSLYLLEGIGVREVALKKGKDLTVYALGWLKEYIDNQPLLDPEHSLPHRTEN